MIGRAQAPLPAEAAESASFHMNPILIQTIAYGQSAKVVLAEQRWGKRHCRSDTTKDGRGVCPVVQKSYETLRHSMT